MSTVSGKISVILSIAEVLSGGLKSGGPTHLLDLSQLQTVNLGNGTGAGQIDRVYSESGTALAASTTVDKDFAGSLLDSAGATITFAKVKLLAFYNSGTTDMTLKAKTGAPFALLNGTTDAIKVPAGALALFFFPAGVAVADTTTDKITIGNSSASVAASFSLVVAGTSA